MPLIHTPARFADTPCIRLERDGATAIVALHGGQVLSWTTADGIERLFLGERAGAGVAPGGAIRGGIPVIFPQFGERGVLRRHGFARHLPWAFAGSDGEAAVFVLEDGPGTAEWPHAFACRVAVSPAAQRLVVALEVENRGHDTFAFAAALHTYLRVDALEQVHVEGLQGCDYEDTAAGGTLHRQTDHAVVFEGEVDRLYGDVVAPLELVEGSRRVQLEHAGFGDAVVWNPGERLAAGIGDLAPGEHRQFVCIEAAQVLQPVVLPPGERWQGEQRLDAIAG